MKTVKDYLDKLNTTRLVDAYFGEFGEKLFDLYYDNTPNSYYDEYIEYDDTVRELTVMEYAQAKRKEIYDYIRFLKEVDTEDSPTMKTGIIYAFAKYEEGCFDRWQVRLLFLEELFADPENCRNRNISAVPFREVLMFRVADNKFTQEIIYKVIAHVLWIASLTGFRQENREKFLKVIEENGSDYMPYKPIDEWSRFSFGDDPSRIGHNETAESQEKLNEVRKAIYEYEMCTMKREREIILRSYGR